MPRLFVFGLGYTAQALARRLVPQGWTVAGTSREPAKAADLRAAGIDAQVFDGTAALPASALEGATHLLASIPPDPPDSGDPALRLHAGAIRASGSLAWVGYLSTTSVYGVDDGRWVDEDAPCAPDSTRGQRRLAAERAWQGLALPAHVFRLSGIYGPGRSVFDTIRAGRAKRVMKPGHAFNRIHVDDIAQTLEASMRRPNPGRIYNLADDLPAPSADLVTFACALTGREPPPEIPFEEAAFSPMARAFWAENKRVSNVRIKQELGVELLYPTYREGLRAIHAQESARR